MATKYGAAQRYSCKSAVNIGQRHALQLVQTKHFFHTECLQVKDMFTAVGIIATQVLRPVQVFHKT